MKKRTAFIGALFSLIPCGQPIFFGTTSLLTSTATIYSLSVYADSKNADFFFKPKDINHLKEFLREANKNNINITILGAGSNILFRDKGVRGVVIKLGKEFSFIKKIGEDILEVGAATLDRKVANFAMKNNLKTF